MDIVFVIMKAAFIALLIEVFEWRRRQWGRRRQRAANKRFEWQERIDRLDIELKRVLMRIE